MPCKDSEKARIRQKIADGNRYTKRQEEKKCTKCGKQDNRTLSGRSLCEECAQKNSEYYRKRKKKSIEEHTCLRCHKPLTESEIESEQIICDECKQTDSEQYKTRQENRRKAGLCVLCGKQDAFTMMNRCICAECMEKRKEFNKSHYDAERVKEYRKRYIDKCLSEKRCIRCGKPLPGQDYRQQSCPACRAKLRKYNHAEYVSDGICVRCKKKPVYGDFKLCKTCYDKVIQAQKKGQAVLAERKRQNGQIKMD